MRNLILFSVAALLLVSTSSVKADTVGDYMPPAVRSIDRTCLPAGPIKPAVPMFLGDLNEKYQEIANIDSYVAMDKCEATTKLQLKDLQAKGQAVGADALIRVRILKNDIQGWKENPDTPFFSVHQGGSSDYFYRATAIRYLRPPVGEPEEMGVKVAVSSPVNQTSPLIDTNQILKLNRGKNRRSEVTVPEVYTTQKAQGQP